MSKFWIFFFKFQFFTTTFTTHPQIVQEVRARLTAATTLPLTLELELENSPFYIAAAGNLINWMLSNWLGTPVPVRIDVVRFILVGKMARRKRETTCVCPGSIPGRVVNLRIRAYS